MVQSRSGTRFPSKTFQCLRTTGQPLRQKLQGGEAAQCGVLGLVDDPIPAQLIATGIIGGLLELFSAKFFIERAADDLAQKLVERVVKRCAFSRLITRHLSGGVYEAPKFWLIVQAF
jgi:hypothetical protein